MFFKKTKNCYLQVFLEMTDHKIDKFINTELEISSDEIDEKAFDEE